MIGGVIPLRVERRSIMNRFVFSVISGHLITIAIIFVVAGCQPSERVADILLWNVDLVCWLAGKIGHGGNEIFLCLAGALLTVPIYCAGTYAVLLLIAKVQQKMRAAV